MARRLLFQQLAVIVFVGLLHHLGHLYFLYWHLWWYDIIVHFLGGLWLGLAASWVLTLLSYQIRFFLIIAAAIGVGIFWELFELWGGIPREANFALDTTIDLSMDLIGATVAYMFVRSRREETTVNGTIAP